MTGIIDEVFSPYFATVTMHPMTYDDLEQLKKSLVETIKQASEYYPILDRIMVSEYALTGEDNDE